MSNEEKLWASKMNKTRTDALEPKASEEASHHGSPAGDSPQPYGVSIVIPVYNPGEFLRQALESIHA